MDFKYGDYWIIEISLNMLEHFKKADQEFIIKGQDWIDQVYDKQVIKVTGFLNPFEQYILKTLRNQQSEVDVLFEGGFKNAERNRAVIFSSHTRPKSFEKKVNGFQIKYNTKFLMLEHRQILGSLMALKIERSVIGDIVSLENGKIYFAICEEFSLFIEAQLTKVGHHSVSLIETNLQTIEKNDPFVEREVIVSSMRLDLLVASLMNVSRSRAHEHIKQGFIQLNYSSEKNHSHHCRIGDLLSIRSYGRYKLIAEKRITRNGKKVIVIGKAK